MFDRMTMTLEYGCHGLPKNVDIELIQGKTSESANMLQNWNTKPVAIVVPSNPAWAVIVFCTNAPFFYQNLAILKYCTCITKYEVYRATNRTFFIKLTIQVGA